MEELMAFGRCADNTRRAIRPLTRSSDDLLACFADRQLFLPTLQTLGTEQRRSEWLAVHLLVRELLGHELLIAHRPNGAPYLPDSTLHISISHTKGFVVVVLSEQPTATDIEYVSDRVLRVASRFMSDAERLHIDPCRKAEHTLLHWCAKETLYKRIGRKGLDLRRDLHVLPFPLEEEGAITATCAPQGLTIRLHYCLTDAYAWVWMP